ncbi:hypothetical protein LXL04_018333 [Taraxacum kok-saghyz]
MTVEWEPEDVKGVRTQEEEQGLRTEVLIKWKGAPEHDSTWEDFNTLQVNYPDLDLEDKSQQKTMDLFSELKRFERRASLNHAGKCKLVRAFTGDVHLTKCGDCFCELGVLRKRRNHSSPRYQVSLRHFVE